MWPFELWLMPEKQLSKAAKKGDIELTKAMQHLLKKAYSIRQAKPERAANICFALMEIDSENETINRIREDSLCLLESISDHMSKEFNALISELEEFKKV